jgi:hypothetical protein
MKITFKKGGFEGWWQVFVDYDVGIGPMSIGAVEEIRKGYWRMGHHVFIPLNWSHSMRRFPTRKRAAEALIDLENEMEKEGT